MCSASAPCVAGFDFQPQLRHDWWRNARGPERLRIHWRRARRRIARWVLISDGVYHPLRVQGLIVLAASLSYISMNMLSKAAATHSAARRIAQDETMSPNTIRKQLQSAPLLSLARSWRCHPFHPSIDIAQVRLSRGRVIWRMAGHSDALDRRLLLLGIYRRVRQLS